MGNFNPNEHMMQLKGKDYLQVAWRLVWFREDHPDWSVDAQALEITEDHAIFKAEIRDADGMQKSSGHGSESKRDFGDFIEKAETKAIGRALAMLGYGTQFAGTELDEGSRIVDSPIDRTLKEAPNEEIKPGDLPKRGAFNARAAISAYCLEKGITAKDFNDKRLELIKENKIPSVKYDDMDEAYYRQLIAAYEGGT